MYACMPTNGIELRPLARSHLQRREQLACRGYLPLRQKEADSRQLRILPGRLARRGDRLTLRKKHLVRLATELTAQQPAFKRGTLAGGATIASHPPSTQRQN